MTFANMLHANAVALLGLARANLAIHRGYRVLHRLMRFTGYRQNEGEGTNLGWKRHDSVCVAHMVAGLVAGRCGAIMGERVAKPW